MLFVNNWGSNPSINFLLYFFKISLGQNFGISKILKNFPDWIFAWIVYRPSTNKKFSFFKTIANPADPVKFEIVFSLSGLENSEK